MLERISASLILLISILFFPFWLTAILALGAVFYFDLFWEVVPLFLLSDLLYGVEGPRFFETTYLSFIISIIVLLAIEFIKKKSVFYPNKINR